MIAAWRELPIGPDRPAPLLCWIFALLVYAAGLCGVGCLVLDDALGASDAALATNWTVQVPADASDARLQTVLALLRQTGGIAALRLLEPAETARLLEPWLGPAVPDRLPLPRLIDLHIAPGAKIDVAALRRQLAGIVPEARLDDRLPWPPGMREALRRTLALLAAGTALALLAVAAASVIAARGVAISARSVVALALALGASDAVIARHFAVRAARLALIGGAIGGAVALLTIAACGGAGALVQLPAPLSAGGIADWRVWAILIGVVAAAATLASASTAPAMRRRLAGMP